jgi:hypothetical protein
MSDADAGAERKQRRRPSADTKGPVIADDRGIPPQLTSWAMVIGLLFFVVGVLLIILRPPAMVADHRAFNVALLGACMGFGLVLAVFGTRIAGTWQKFSIVGSLGTTIVLFLLATMMPPPAPPLVPSYPSAFRGELHNSAGFAGMTIMTVKPLLVGRPQRGANFQFAAFHDDLETKMKDFFITIERPKNNQEARDADNQTPDSIIGCIPIEVLKARLGSKSLVNFSIEKKGEDYYLHDRHESRSHGIAGSTNCPEGQPLRLDIGELPGRAIAVTWDLIAAAITRPAMAQAASPKISELIRALESEDSDARVVARDELAKYGDLESLKEMTKDWDVRSSTYRGDLGRLVAWLSAIRRNRAVAVPLVMALTDEQVSYIVRLTGHDDRTMRLNATEILMWLLQVTGWPNPPAAEKSDFLMKEAAKVFLRPDAFAADAGKRVDFPNVAYNTLVAVDTVKCTLKPDARRVLVEAVQSFEQKHLPNMPSPRKTQMSQKVQTIVRAC